MGIGLQALRVTGMLWRNGYLNGFSSIMEIGAQDVVAPPSKIPSALGRIPEMPFPEAAVTAEQLYGFLGFNCYRCIDTDGCPSALAFDLNKNIEQTYGFTETFDLVTNHGTTEHVFNQYTAFENIHNLCRAGGIILHGLPFQGYLDHGFYNYQPFFFNALAEVNKYEVIGIYLNPHDSSPEIIPYTRELMEYLQNTPGRNTALFVVLRKTIDEPFRASFDFRFGTIENVGLEYDPCLDPKSQQEYEPPSQIVGLNRAIRELQQTIHEMADRIQWMESSRFWKLRSACASLGRMIPWRRR